MFGFALALLRLVSQIFQMLEAKRLISEGERRQILKELELAAKSAAVAVTIRKEVSTKSDAEVDAAIGPDFRD